MLSIVVYGRNDSHGYNMHKRVAVSLNAMAAVLCRDDDEIIFVDYATPWPLPTLPEALADTLTRECRDRLRVVRVPVETHVSLIGDRTHLHISEPLARNVGIRRAAPASQWILNTNTDMVFVPRQGDGLLPQLGELAGDFYGIPRFELPEWLWERLDRLDPQTTIESLREWGPALCLNEATIAHPWIQFDAPGDFQLVRREAIEAVAGFDERMIWGWHVDSNLSRRLGLAGYRLESLRDEISGYHTNHDRVPTLLAREQRKGNDLRRFFYEVDEAVPDGQEESWGAPDIEFEEVRLDDNRLRVLVERFAVDWGARHGSTRDLHALDDWTRIDYDVRHVLPFAMDFVVASAQTSLVGYVGVSAEMRAALTGVLSGLGGQLCDVDAKTAPDIDVAIVDLGLGGYPDTSHPAARAQLATLLEIVEEAFDVIGKMQPACRIVLINAQSGIWRNWLTHQVVLAPGTLHSRVQLARLAECRDVPEFERARVAHSLNWLARDPDAPNAGRVEHDGVVYLDSVSFDGFGEGWDTFDGHGVRMNDESATLTVAVPSLGSDNWGLLLAVRRIDDDDPNLVGPMRVIVEIGGTHVAQLCFGPRSYAAVATYDVSAYIDPGQVATIRFRVVRDDGAVYAPRFGCDALGRREAWIRVEEIGLCRLPSAALDGVVEYKFDKTRGLLPAVASGWEGLSGGLAFGPNPGSIWLPVPVPSGAMLGLELWRSGALTRRDADLSVFAGANTATIRLRAEHPFYRVVLPLEDAVDPQTEIRLAIDPWRTRTDEVPGGDWRLGTLRVLGRPTQRLVVDTPELPLSPAVTLLGGWSWSELAGVWSTEECAECMVLIPPGSPSGVLRVSLNAFPGTRSGISVTAGDCRGALVESEGDRRVFELPARVADQDGLVRLVIAARQRYSPHERFGTGDERLLGAFFTSVEYRAESGKKSAWTTRLPSLGRLRSRRGRE